jgi:branched-chain amino acid transport system substrate-binding protein
MKRATRLRAVAGLVVVILLAAACAKKAGPSASEIQQKCRADKFGCVTYGPGEPIKVGTLLAISGDVATLGLDSQRAVQLAIDYLDGKLDGKPGQLLGHPVTMVNKDDGCSKEGGQAGATQLAADPKILAVIGTSCSSAALGVADKILSDKGILLISPSNTNPNLTAPGTHQPFYLRTAHNDKLQGAVVADFAFNQLGAKTAATIHDESPYADALAAVFREDFEKLGGTITPNGNQAIQSTDTDFHPLLQTIARDHPDVLYFPDFNPACALITKQAREISGLEKTALIGSDGCLASTFLEQAGDAAKGAYASGPDFSAFSSNQFYANQFLPAYKQQFGTAPTASFHAHAWDAFNILVQAVKKVAIRSSDGTVTIPRTALKDAIFQTKDYKGLSGTITCLPDGDCATGVTIGIFKAPDWPVEGGNPNAKPVFTETKSTSEIAGG